MTLKEKAIAAAAYDVKGLIEGGELFTFLSEKSRKSIDLLEAEADGEDEQFEATLAYMDAFYSRVQDFLYIGRMLEGGIKKW